MGWQDKWIMIAQVIQVANCELSAWSQAQQQLPQHVARSSVSHPSEPMLKCNNIDPSLLNNEERIGLGWVLRDTTGKFLGGGQQSGFWLLDVDLAEALVLCAALYWLRQYNFCNVFFGNAFSQNLFHADRFFFFWILFYFNL